MHRVHPLRTKGTPTPAFSSLLPLSFPQLPLEIKSLTSSMFLMHAGCTPASSPGMFWYILEYSGIVLECSSPSFHTPFKSFLK